MSGRNSGEAIPLAALTMIEDDPMIISDRAIIYPTGIWGD
jgi:hypothetical protein